MSAEAGHDPWLCVAGVGAVSPAGWGLEPLMAAVCEQGGVGRIPPVVEVERSPRGRPLRLRAVPAPAPRPAWMAHPRLRRASAISHHAVGAALEALGPEVVQAVRDRRFRLGVVLTVMTGSVIYSRRFYDEVLKDPPTASPLLFPETVFNAPASHLAAVLGTPAIQYTLVGDPSQFLEGLAIAADWLVEGGVDGVVVVGAEESDWLTAEAWELFARGVPLAAGAGAVFLRKGDMAGGVALAAITPAHSHHGLAERREALRAARGELETAGVWGGTAGLLVDGRSGSRRFDAGETAVWEDWTGERISPLRVLGEGLAAGSAWQVAVAWEWLRRRSAGEATVSVAGVNEAAACASLVWRG